MDRFIEISDFERILISGPVNGQQAYLEQLTKTARAHQCDAIFFLGNSGYFPTLTKNTINAEDIPVFFIAGNFEDFHSLNFNKLIELKEMLYYVPSGFKLLLGETSFYVASGANIESRSRRLYNYAQAYAVLLFGEEVVVESTYQSKLDIIVRAMEDTFKLNKDANYFVNYLTVTLELDGSQKNFLQNWPAVKNNVICEFLQGSLAISEDATLEPPKIEGVDQVDVILSFLGPDLVPNQLHHSEEDLNYSRVISRLMESTKASYLFHAVTDSREIPQMSRPGVMGFTGAFAMQPQAVIFDTLTKRITQRVPISGIKGLRVLQTKHLG
ncbi:MAG: hypothetical protein MK193_11195 [Lentisphaeria bacterium]|nr:hypothetical protein [Lentisphaeria bacterium]